MDANDSQKMVYAYRQKVREHPIGMALYGVMYLLGLALALYLMWYALNPSITRVRFASGFLGISLALFYTSQIVQRLGIEPKSDPDAKAAEEEMSDRVDIGGILDIDPLGVGARYEALKRRVDKVIPVDGIIAVIYILLGITALLVAVYIEMEFDRLLETAPVVGFQDMDVLVGAVAIFLVIHATRVAYGNILTLVIIGTLLFARYGNHPTVPDIIQHFGLEWRDVAISGAISFNGVYGFVLGIGATWIAIFIVFAGMLRTFGAVTYINKLAQELNKYFRTGVVQVAVISSLVMGSLTGSAVANTATTGSFTIPLMKRQGVRQDFAGAIESVASSGGQMMPPVMGVAAFLMADILDVPYLDILQYALIPALLFYFSIAISVHLLAYKYDWLTRPTGTLDRRMLLEGIHFLVPLIVLLWVLVIQKLSPLAAGRWAIISLLAVFLLKRTGIVVASEVGGFGQDQSTDNMGQNTGGRRAHRATFTAIVLGIAAAIKTALDGFKDGAIDMAPLTAVLASIGLAIAMINKTGTAPKISAQMVNFGGESVILILFLAMVTSLLFGLGMPTVAAYLLLVTLVAPALIDFGVRPVTTHMFVLYFGMLSAITPPVALAVVVGSKIADSNFLRTSKQAVRIGLAGFIVPYIFAKNTSLLYWSFPETIVMTGVAAISLVALTVSAVAFNMRQNLNIPGRIIYIVLAFVGMFGPFVTQITSVLVVLSLFVLAYHDMTPKFLVRTGRTEA